MNQPFPFELVSPERLVFSERATQVVVPGAEGRFTVMANHASLMTTVGIGVMEAEFESGDKKKILIDGGFADVSPAGLTLLAEHAMDLENFDIDELEQQIRNTQEDVSDAKTEEKRKKVQLSLNRLEHIKEVISEIDQN